MLVAEGWSVEEVWWNPEDLASEETLTTRADAALNKVADCAARRREIVRFTRTAFRGAASGERQMASVDLLDELVVMSDTATRRKITK